MSSDLQRTEWCEYSKGADNCNPIRDLDHRRAPLRVVGDVEIGRLCNSPKTVKGHRAKGAAIPVARPDGFGVRQPSAAFRPSIPCSTDNSEMRPHRLRGYF